MTITPEDVRALDRLHADMQRISSCKDAPVGTDAHVSHIVPLVAIGPPGYEHDIAGRPVTLTRPVRGKEPPVWESVAQRLPKDARIGVDLDITLEYRFERGERGARDYPGDPAHVTATGAFLPAEFCRAILRNLTHELLTTSFGRLGSSTMLSEESVHDFIRNAGLNVLNVVEAVRDDADEKAADEDHPERFSHES